jgi:hypothetical protein
MAETETKTAVKATDGMMDLFAATAVEDSSQGKFAAGLKEMEAKEVLRDALWIRDRLNGVKE